MRLLDVIQDCPRCRPHTTLVEAITPGELMAHVALIGLTAAVMWTPSQISRVTPAHLTLAIGLSITGGLCLGLPLRFLHGSPVKIAAIGGFISSIVWFVILEIAASGVIGKVGDFVQLGAPFLAGLAVWSRCRLHSECAIVLILPSFVIMYSIPGIGFVLDHLPF